MRSIKKLYEQYSPPIVIRETMMVMCGTWWVQENEKGWHLVRAVEQATQFDDFEKCFRLASEVQKSSEQMVRIIGCSTVEE